MDGDGRGIRRQLVSGAGYEHPGPDGAGGAGKEGRQLSVKNDN